jgi:hypothetical protein
MTDRKEQMRLRREKQHERAEVVEKAERKHLTNDQKEQYAGLLSAVLSMALMGRTK